MQSSLNKKDDFIIGIKSMSETTSSFKHQNKDYLIYFSLGDDQETLVITITDALNYLWAKELDLSDFDLIRRDLGLEGTFENFFQLFRDAILLLNGSFRINVLANTMDLDLVITYKISKTATLAGEINIGTPMHFEENKDMFRQFIRKTVFDLQEAKKKESYNLEKSVLDLKTRLRNAEDRITYLSKSLPNIPETVMENNEANKEDSKKKKANASLINPVLKKRKGMGAKLG